MELVHILDVITACRDTRVWLATNHEVLQAARRDEILVAMASIRAEHGIVRLQVRHGAFHGNALAVRQSLKEARTTAVSDCKNGELPPRQTAYHFQPLRREILPSWTR